MGIICASLATLGPLIGRLRDISNNGSKRTLDKDGSKNSVGLRNLRSRPTLNQSNVGESRTGFARLPGDVESGLSDLVATVPRDAVVTTHVGTSPSGFEEPPVIPEAIIRQQTLEQHHQRRIDGF